MFFFFQKELCCSWWLFENACIFWTPPPPFFFQKHNKFGEIDKCPIFFKFSISNRQFLFINLYASYKPTQSEAYSLTILVLFKSLILSVILEMLWLPTNLIICVVVVNLESTLIADNFRLCKNKTKYSYMYIHIYVQKQGWKCWPIVIDF